MENVNCLKGFECPDCGHTESFDIAARVTLRVTDDGSETTGDTEWDDDERCQCGGCGYSRLVLHFKKENQIWSCCDSPKAVDDILHRADGECPFCNPAS